MRHNLVPVFLVLAVACAKPTTQAKVDETATISGEAALALGASAAASVLSSIASTDKDSTTGGKELNELVPELGHALAEAPPADAAVAGSSPARSAARDAFSNSTLVGPVQGPDDNGGWYYWDYSYGPNTWRSWMKSEPAFDFHQGWPVGVTTWWWAWTGEAGSSVGYKYVSKYTVLSNSQVQGEYRFDVAAPAAAAGSYFAGEYDWTNQQVVSGAYTSSNTWRSHWVNNGGAQDNFGRFDSSGTASDGNWSSTFRWYLGAGTTVDPVYTEQGACPGGNWASSTAGNGLVYWGEGTNEFSDGGWSGDYCSSRFDCTQQCYSYSRPKFAWTSACVRRLQVFEGDFETSSEAGATSRWDLQSSFAQGAYVPSPMKYNSKVANTAGERGGESLGSNGVYTLVLTKNDGSTTKKKFAATERTVSVSLDGDACGGVIQSVAVTPQTGSIVVGQTLQLTASVLDNYGNNVPVSFAWSSDDAGVCSVTSQGVARGVSTGSTSIRASVGGLSAAASVSVSSAPVPAVPSNPAAFGGDGQVLVSFAGSEIATSYNVYYLAGTTVTKATGTKVSGTASPVVVSGLTNGTQYAFVVSASNAAGESAVSSVVLATPQVATAKVFSAGVKVNDVALADGVPKVSLGLYGGQPSIAWMPAGVGALLFDQMDGLTFGTDALGPTGDRGTQPFVFGAAGGDAYIFYSNTLPRLATATAGVLNTPPQTPLAGAPTPTTVCGIKAVTSMNAGEDGFLMVYKTGSKPDEQLRVARSEDSGATWTFATSTLLPQAQIPFSACSALGMAVAGDKLYLTWTTGQQDISVELLTVDLSGILEPVLAHLDTAFGNTSASVAALGLDVAVCWANATGVRCRTTSDGTTFAAAALASQAANGTGFSDVSVAFDSSAGLHVAYYAFNSMPSARYDIFYNFSGDGQTFGATSSLVSANADAAIFKQDPALVSDGTFVGVTWIQGEGSYDIYFALGQ